MKTIIVVLFFNFFISCLAFADVNTRIFNGYNSQHKSWMVSISRKAEAGIVGHFCGGALIEKDWIVTAAHCVREFFNSPHKLYIHFGSANLRESKTVQADGLIIHEHYDEISSTHDIALVHLSTPVDANTLSVFPGSFNDLVGSDANAYGWGLTQISQADYKPVEDLQAVNLHIQAPEVCQNGLKNLFDSFTMFCAGELSTSESLQNGKDSCYGDSGGPLTTGSPGEEQLIGIVSWGLECASSKTYGVYTNVPNLREWLYQPRIIPSYALNSPTISGEPVVGKQLYCKQPKIANYSGSKLQYRWRDYASGRILSKSKKLTLTKALEKRKLICEVKIQSQKATTYAYSKTTKRIRSNIN